MKYAIRFLTIMTATLVFSGTVAGQKASFTTNDGLTLGFGLGGSYQSSDIANSIGAGFDFTFGSHLYKRDDAFLAVDWKFRFLAGENIAYDHRENIDGTFSNNKLSLFNYDIEIGLTLNRLRERTRIVITGFAGPGITHGRTFSDLLDEGGSPYDFSSIDPSKPRGDVKADLIALSDGEFETQVTNKAAILPTAGIYIGYQFSRSFSMGIEHKTNFSFSEKNSAFGIDIDNNIVNGSKIDKIHYTTLGFKWILGGGGGYSRGGVPYETTYTPPYTPQRVVSEPPVTQERQVVRIDPPGQPPVTTQSVTRPPVTNPAVTKPPVTAAALPSVKFINPPTPATVDRNSFPLRVQLTNVPSWNDVTVSVNGSSLTNFSLSREGLVTTNIGLREGSNLIEVTGKNEAGKASERTTITYNRAVTATPPVTTVTTPPVTTVTTPPVTTVTTPPVTTVTTPPVTTVTTPPVTTVTTPPVTTVTTPPVTTVTTPPVTTVTTPPVTTVTTPPVTTVTTPPVTTVTTPPVTTVTTPPVTTVTTPPVTTVTTPPVTTVTTPPVTTVTTPPVTTVTTPPVTTVTTPPVTTVTTPPVTTVTTLPVTTVTTPPVTTVTTPPVTTVTTPPVTTVTTPPVTEVEETACGPRINPGNSAWQFCLVTPSGTYNRDNLTNSSFSYSGAASSLFFMPIAGGGDVIVNGKPYPVRSGQYYLFTGRLTVSVSTKNPGSMGQWSVCITSDRAPLSGNGNNRPQSPCEAGEKR